MEQGRFNSPRVWDAPDTGTVRMLLVSEICLSNWPKISSDSPKEYSPTRQTAAAPRYVRLGDPQKGMAIKPVSQVVRRPYGAGVDHAGGAVLTRLQVLALGDPDPKLHAVPEEECPQLAVAGGYLPAYTKHPGSRANAGISSIRRPTG